MKDYFYNLICAWSCFVNALLGGKFPDTLSMRIRRYDAAYGNDYPLKLKPFRLLRGIVCKVDEHHFEEDLEDVVSEIREVLAKHYPKKGV